MSILTAVKGIFSIISFVSKIRDLVGGNAGSVITIADLERVVRGEHARFFTTIAFADIATIHDQFYRNWLPSIAMRDKISAEDISSQSGALFFVFQDLIRVRTELSVLLNRFREVVRAYQSELHIDELVDGVLASIHGFALLFHIHGVYAELRRIQIGARYLYDERLLTDTNAAMQYFNDAKSTLDLFMNSSTIQKRRLDMISPLQYFSGSYMFPPSWSFGDSYRPRASTPANSSLYVYVSANKLTESVARERRNQHIVNVTNKMGDVFANTTKDVRWEYTLFFPVLYERYCVQTGLPLPGEEPFEPISIDLEERVARHEFVVTVPFDADEFILMSKRIKKEAIEFAENDRATRRRIRASL